MSTLVESPRGSKYSDEDRRRAIVEYSVQGTLTRTAENTNIPYNTLCTWRQQEWWETAINEVREQNKEIIEAKYEQAILSGLDGILDRIALGDEYITKDGDKARKAVSLRDLSTATGIAFDKLRLHRNQPTSIRAESTDERLHQLAEKVRELQGGMVIIDQNGDKVSD